MRAQHLMPTPRKWTANMIKLVVLSALFVLLVNVEGWYWQVLTLLAAGLSYPLLLQPINLNIARPFIPTAVEEVKRRQNVVANEAEPH